MMIIQDEQPSNAESTMIGEQNSIIKDDEINDLSISKSSPEKRNEDPFKSPNKRKQIKPNRVSNEDDGVPTDLTNGQSPSSDNNPDQYSPTKAYCNLCERSFCNKYFLKTHFAKKHGVLNATSLSPASAELPTNQSISPASSSPVPSTEPPPPPSQKVSEDYCEICQKRFCNKYYLRKHKGECHGIYTDYIKSLQKSATESPVKSQPSRPSQVPSNMLLLNPFYLPATAAPAEGKTPLPRSQNSNGCVSPASSLNLFPQRAVRRCHVCQQEFRNKALLRMHVNTFHPNETNRKNLNVKPPSTAPTFPISPSNTLGFLQPYVDTSSPLAHKLVAGQAPQASYGILHDSYFCAKMADRVVCEICNKQVCNKYFLKTHKAKVHGITTNGTNHSGNGNADNTPPTMVPPSTLHQPALTDVIKSPDPDDHQDEQDNDNSALETNDLNDSNNENTDTYCFLCKKDFPSKYLYLFHMQTTHNETSDPTYRTLIQFMKAAAAMNENSVPNPFLSLAAAPASHSDQQDPESEDESDGNLPPLKRKRSSSQSSAETNKRLSSRTEANGGLQPFLLESEDPKFAHTFVPCMVYLPVIRRVTKQVKINLRLKPVLTDTSS